MPDSAATITRFLHEVDEFDLHDDQTLDGHEDDKPWGAVIGACLLVQLVTLIGIIISGTVRGNKNARWLQGKKSVWLYAINHIAIPSFAAGALLATAVFLLVPESLILIGGGHEAHDEEHNDTSRWRRFLGEGDTTHEEEGHNENEIAWKFGVSLLSGFIFPAILYAIFPHGHGDEPSRETHGSTVEDCPEQTAEAIQEPQDMPDNSAQKNPPDGLHDEEEIKVADSSQGTTTTLETFDESSLTKTKNWGLAMSVLVGDFFHNFTDGVFIGTAFLLCGKEFGWTVVAATIYHELAQEIADFALLTHHCGFNIWQALALNFMSGFSIILGGIVVLATDVNHFSQGIILAFSAGVYCYLSGTECMPRAQKAAQTSRQNMLFLCCFVMGVIPIGLVLLNHQHCEAGHGEDEHHDHNH